MEAIFSLLVLSLLPLTSLSLSLQTLHNTPSFDYNLALFGDAEIADGGSSVQLTRPIPSSSGLLLSEKPFKFLEPNPVPKPTSFSTEFSFSISPHSGDGISLVLVPADFPRKFSGKEKSHFGFSREINKFLGIELNANHIGVDVCGFGSSRVRNVSSSIGLVLNSGKKLRAWVDYEASSKRLEVRLSELGKNVRPYDPVIAFPIDLSEMWRGEKVLVGLSSSSGNSIQTCSVYSWEFRVKIFPNWMHSQPVDPLMYTEKERAKSKRSPCLLTILSGLMLVIGCGVLVALTVLALWGIVNRRAVIPALHPVGYEKVSVVVEDSSENGKN